MSIASDSQIAIIGAGIMGSGIAQIAAQAGHRVTVIDALPAALERSASDIAKAMDRLVERQRITARAAGQVMARLSFSTELADAAPAALVIEAIVEREDAKRALFATLEGIISPQACLASNTSSFSINALARDLRVPARFAGLHFFNPVPVMKLVEVVPAAATDPTLTADLAGLMRRWGKIAVILRDVPGFIVNRVARPYYAEGFLALSEGIPAATIDHLLQGAGGFRLGPLALADMIGHDINATVAASIHAAYGGATRFRPQPAQQALVAAGHLGRKSGQGVYDYGEPLPLAPFVMGDRAPAVLLSARDPAVLGPLVDQARAVGLPVSVEDSLPSGHLVCDGIRIAAGDGRLLARRDDVDVLLDAARDWASASCLGITARDEGSAARIASLFTALGKRTLRLPDRAGGLVLRTLAQLANAAADALADDVADAAAIDAAMMHGANHPEGPLAWAERYGHAALGKALDAIAAASGDPLYRPAALFQSGSHQP